eukprot:626306-Alexandrium_andersonii.AAC.1
MATRGTRSLWLQLTTITARSMRVRANTMYCTPPDVAVAHAAARACAMQWGRGVHQAITHSATTITCPGSGAGRGRRWACVLGGVKLRRVGGLGNLGACRASRGGRGRGASQARGA